MKEFSAAPSRTVLLQKAQGELASRPGAKQRIPHKTDLSLHTHSPIIFTFTNAFTQQTRVVHRFRRQAPVNFHASPSSHGHKQLYEKNLEFLEMHWFQGRQSSCEKSGPAP